jgi:hypothetical protein
MTIDFIGNSAFLMKSSEMLTLFVVSVRYIRVWVYVVKRTRGYLFKNSIIHFLNFPTHISFIQAVTDDISFP